MQGWIAVGLHDGLLLFEKYPRLNTFADVTIGGSEEVYEGEDAKFTCSFTATDLTTTVEIFSIRTEGGDPVHEGYL